MHTRKTRWHILALSAAALALGGACTSDEAGSPGDAGSHEDGHLPDPDGGRPDGGGKPLPACPVARGTAGVNAAGFEVRENGEAKPGTLSARAEWTEAAGREVLRIVLSIDDDPIPAAADDEIGYSVTLDLVPSQALEQRGETLRIDQRFEVMEPTADYAGSRAVKVTPGPDDSGIARRVTVQQNCFCATAEQVSYRVRGTLTLDRAAERRFQGTLELDFEGDLPYAPGAPHTLALTGCFDVEPPAPAGCVPGDSCGNDCIPPDDYVCWACGTLYARHDCSCRADQPPLDECAGEGPAAEGEACGQWWWCDRDCAPGLTCTLDPSYGPRDEDDAGLDSCAYHTCQRP